MVVHEKLLKELERRRRAARFYEKALARLDGNWAGTGEPGDRYKEASHPYALDLDLFGKGSVFELLCTARTRIGEDRLAQWLKSPAAPEVVRARHAAVEELRDRVDLREELAIVAEEARSGVDPVHLAHWGEAPAALRQSRLPLARSPAYFARPGRFCGALDSPGAGGKPDRPDRWRGCALARPVPGGARWSTAGSCTAKAPSWAPRFRQWRRRPTNWDCFPKCWCAWSASSSAAPLLAGLRASLDAEGEPPSRQLARLKRLVENLDSRDNVVVRVLEPFILWTPHLAVRVEDWRAQSGTAVRRWLQAAGEMEALCSLASHAFEHPADPFPEFVPEGPVDRSRSHRPPAAGRR